MKGTSRASVAPTPVHLRATPLAGSSAPRRSAFSIGAGPEGAGCGRPLTEEAVDGKALPQYRCHDGGDTVDGGEEKEALLIAPPACCRVRISSSGATATTATARAAMPARAGA